MLLHCITHIYTVYCRLYYTRYIILEPLTSVQKGRWRVNSSDATVKNSDIPLQSNVDCWKKYTTLPVDGVHEWRAGWKMFSCHLKRDENRQTDWWHGLPLSGTLLNSWAFKRANHARTDELRRDKKGLWDGRGLKKWKRVERRDEETVKWALIVL